jgi:hypothetical protein
MSAGKIMVTIFWVEKVLFLWTSCLGDNSELLTLHSNNSKSECLASWVCPTKRMSQTVAQHLVTHKPAHNRGHHRLHWVLPYPPYSPDPCTIPLTHFWSLIKNTCKNIITSMTRYCGMLCTSGWKRKVSNFTMWEYMLFN